MIYRFFQMLLLWTPHCCIDIRILYIILVSEAVKSLQTNKSFDPIQCIEQNDLDRLKMNQSFVHFFRGIGYTEF